MSGRQVVLLRQAVEARKAAKVEVELDILRQLVLGRTDIEYAYDRLAQLLSAAGATDDALAVLDQALDDPSIRKKRAMRKRRAGLSGT